MTGTTVLYTHGCSHVSVFQILQRQFISRNGINGFVGTSRFQQDSYICTFFHAGLPLPKNSFKPACNSYLRGHMVWVQRQFISRNGMDSFVGASRFQPESYICTLFDAGLFLPENSFTSTCNSYLRGHMAGVSGFAKAIYFLKWYGQFCWCLPVARKELYWYPFSHRTHWTCPAKQFPCTYFHLQIHILLQWLKNGLRILLNPSFWTIARHIWTQMTWESIKPGLYSSTRSLKKLGMLLWDLIFPII